ncbi:MAG: nickel pincer cofactor biosynthesis protein LarC [Synergistaceae bacterium]|nr:nickel pincer cofactor biosynthesis protein LarC [Synergistaceae bacterium]
MGFCGMDPDRILFMDCFAGLSGDMFLSSLIDMTTDGEAYLRKELGKLPLEGYELKISRSSRGGICGLRFEVLQQEGHRHRHLSDIAEIIEQSTLSDKVKSETMSAFAMLAEAEAKVHGEPVDHVHFHEVGAVDSIIDITGAMIMLEHIGWPHVRFSSLNVGSGMVKCEHGMLPVPAPATAELLKGMDVYSSGDPMERVTPTGAVLVKTLAGGTSQMPSGKIQSIGIGLGYRDGELPNLLRATLLSDSRDYGHDQCVVLSANIDDMIPQDLSVSMERLFAAGALDVWFEQIQMKKDRPGIKLCCLGNKPDKDRLAAIILRETTTLGVRSSCVSRTTLARSIDTFMTSLGEVRIKSALSCGKILKQMPEFDDLRRIAEEHGMSLPEVRAVLAGEKFTPPTTVAKEEKKGYSFDLPADLHKHHH